MINKIQAGVAVSGEDFILKGSYLLVEKLPQELKSKSGIALGVSDQFVKGVGSESLTKLRVLAVGAGYYDPDTGEDTPLDTKVGDIIYTDSAAVKYFQTFPGIGFTGGNLGLMDESATQIRFRGEEAVKRFEDACQGIGG